MSSPLFAAGFLGIESFTPPWDIFYLPLFNGLVGLYHLLFSDLALAIIVFTILIRTVLAPVFVRQIRSQREMQRMQPLVKEVQRKYKGDRQKISAETMALYKEHGVNPAAGCLPLLVQLPILIPLYSALSRASGIVNYTPGDDQKAAFAEFLARAGDQIHALGNNNYRIQFEGACNVPSQFSHFLPLNCQLIDPLKLSEGVDTFVNWLAPPWAPEGLNLGGIDNVFAVPFFGIFAISALAVLAAALQFVQAKMTMPNASSSDDPTAQASSMVIYIFPLITIFWGGILPSGLVLYWVVYTAYLIVQQYTMMGWGNLFPIFGWTPRFVPRVSPATGLQAGSQTDDRARRPAPPDSTSSKGSKSDNASPPATRAAAQTPRRSGSQKRRRGRKAR